MTGVAQLWHVYLFAFLFGCASAFDAPVRQTFVAELVADRELANAVALNSTSFNAARMIGPAAAGFIIASVGTGWAFLLNEPASSRCWRRCRCCVPTSCARMREPTARAGACSTGSAMYGSART